MFSRESFDDPYTAAYNYGFAFASHFGPTHGTGNVAAMEVGNEPWMAGHGYPDPDFYNDILLGMARGAKEADPVMRVFPGTFTPEDTFARLNTTHMEYLDGLNTHAYSWFGTARGRTATYPEHPSSVIRGSFFAVKYRDEFFPGMDVYLSELGWDSDGAGQSCEWSECVSEQSQAYYAIRGVLFAARVGFNRVQWFFYANLEESSQAGLFSRCGLTGGPSTGFAPKQSLKALEVFISTLGSKRFLSVLREDDTAFAYVLGDDSGEPSHVVAWRPIDGDNETAIAVEIELPRVPRRAYLLGGWEYEAAAMPSVVSSGVWSVAISSRPVVITFSTDSCGRDGCPAGTSCIAGVCTCSGGAQNSTCSDLAYCLSNRDCASGICKRYRASDGLKVCMPLNLNAVVSATVELTGVSFESFSADDGRTFDTVVASFLPNSTTVLIKEVDSVAIADEETGRRQRRLQDRDDAPTGGSEPTDVHASVITFYLMDHANTSNASAWALFTLLGECIANGQLATALTAEDIGSDVSIDYAVGTNAQLLAVRMIRVDCAAVVEGNAVPDPCGHCNGDGVTCRDCAGVPSGAALNDQCGVCGGDGSCALTLGVDCSFDRIMDTLRREGPAGALGPDISICR